MKSRKPICRYCHHPFHPSLFHPQQTVCLSSACQCRRRGDYHRHKIATDVDYRQSCTDSQRKWRDNHPEYQRHYRSQHEAYCRLNRQKQLTRNHKRKLSRIVKNNLAIDVKQISAEVWMSGPGWGEIVKNNSAVPQVLLFHAVREATTCCST